MKDLTLASLCLLLVACQGSFADEVPWRPAGAPPTIDPDNPVAPPEQPPSVSDAPMARLTELEISNTLRDLYGDEAGALAGEPNQFAGASLESVTAVDAIAQVQLAEAVAELVHQRPDVVTCDPADRDACTAQIVREQGLRILRHPIADARVDRYVAAAATQSSFEAGVYVVLAALLTSPDFLYRIERGAEGSSGGPRALTSWEVASRLSYAIWRSTPDDALLEAAAADELRTREQVQAQVRRMLDDPRARPVVVEFHRWWLHLEQGRNVFRDAEDYPSFAEDDPSRWIAETERFVEHVVFDGEGSLYELFGASYSLVDPELAETYGVSSSDPDAPTELPAAERAGLLTQASIVGGHAPDERVGAIYRGAFLFRQVLCGDIADPPAEIPPLPEADPHASLREQIEVATQSNQPCMSCHDQFNPLGLALGRYDAIGRFGDLDANGIAVDDAVVLTGPGDLRGIEVTGGVELSNELASSAALRDCYVDQWFRYLTGRAPGPADQYSRSLAQYELEVADRDVRELLVSLLSSDALRYVAAADG